MSISSALVTGGTGFVGSAIIGALLEQHPECAITSLDIKPADGDAQRRPTVNYLTVNITDAKEASDAVQEVKPSVIIHAAGIVPTLTGRYTRKDRPLVWRVNVEGTRNMLAAAKEAGVESFVYTSSCCSVTDDLRYQYPNVDETWPTSHHSLIYGESKASLSATNVHGCKLTYQQATAEALALDACSQTLATCAIRPSVIFGPDDYQLIPSVHACIAKHETPFIIGSGDNLWDVTYISNIADAHILAAENLMTTRTAAGEAFFVSNNEPIPFRDFCLEVWKHFGHYPPFEVHIPEQLARFAGYTGEWITWLTGTPTTLSSGSVIDACSTRYCSGVKARKILGYEPRVGIEEGIRISCEAYAKRLAHKVAGNANGMKDHGVMNGNWGMNGRAETLGYKEQSSDGPSNGYIKASNGKTALHYRSEATVKSDGERNGYYHRNGVKNSSSNGNINEDGTRGVRRINGYIFANGVK